MLPPRRLEKAEPGGAPAHTSWSHISWKSSQLYQLGLARASHFFHHHLFAPRLGSNSPLAAICSRSWLAGWPLFIINLSAPFEWAPGWRPGRPGGPLTGAHDCQRADAFGRPGQPPTSAATLFASDWLGPVFNGRAKIASSHLSSRRRPRRRRASASFVLGAFGGSLAPVSICFRRPPPPPGAVLPPLPSYRCRRRLANDDDGESARLPAEQAGETGSERARPGRKLISFRRRRCQRR